MHTANDHPVASETTASLLTTSTFCGTCCDYFVSSRIDMSAASRVTEVAFVLSLDGGGDQCSFSADDCQFAIATRGPSYIRSVDRTLEVCVSDPEGISPDATLLTCDLIAPSYGNPPLALARALGEQFENLDPAPTLTLEDAFSF
jgi:hypothetical protein